MADAVTDALKAMIQHSFDNPMHGVDCVCKDELLRQARRAVKEVTQRFPPDGKGRWTIPEANARLLFDHLTRSVAW